MTNPVYVLAALSDFAVSVLYISKVYTYIADFCDKRVPCLSRVCFIDLSDNATKVGALCEAAVHPSVCPMSLAQKQHVLQLRLL